MKIPGIIFLLLHVLVLQVRAAPFWVFFKQPPQTQISPVSPQAQARVESRGHHDYQVLYQANPLGIDELQGLGVEIRFVSKYLNAASVNLYSTNEQDALRLLPSVERVVPFSEKAPRSEPQIPLTKPSRFSATEYGGSLLQNEILGIPAIHALGYSGREITIGVFDSGFYLAHPAFDQLHILAAYDFVDQEPDPAGVGHEHGINVLSALGGYAPGALIGPAYEASYILARTENDVSETRQEEDNWVAAMEWADSLGVDIISSALNYMEFDNPAHDYPITALDGQTAVITQAANIAAQRGILVVNAAGNEGPGTSSIWPPADSPNILAVGGISASGSVLYFSGRGPTYDGRIKPDIVTLGTGVYVASGSSGYRQVNGTSFATPLVAGLAALFLEAHPNTSPVEMLEIFMTSSDHQSNPDNDRGYGLPQLQSYFQAQIHQGLLQIFPNPYQQGVLSLSLESVEFEDPDIFIIDLLGRTLCRVDTFTPAGSIVQIHERYLQGLTSGLYFVQVTSGGQNRAAKFIILH